MIYNYCPSSTQSKKTRFEIFKWRDTIYRYFRSFCVCYLKKSHVYNNTPGFCCSLYVPFNIFLFIYMVWFCYHNSLCESSTLKDGNLYFSLHLHGVISSIQWLSEWLLLIANSAICQLYHGENYLIFNEMMMRSALY